MSMVARSVVFVLLAGCSSAAWTSEEADGGGAADAGADAARLPGSSLPVRDAAPTLDAGEPEPDASPSADASAPDAQDAARAPDAADAADAAPPPPTFCDVDYVEPRSDPFPAVVHLDVCANGPNPVQVTCCEDGGSLSTCTTPPIYWSCGAPDAGPNPCVLGSPCQFYYFDPATSSTPLAHGHTAR